MSKNDYGKSSPNNGGKQSDSGSKGPQDPNGTDNGQGDGVRFVSPSYNSVDILKLLSELEEVVEKAPRVMGAIIRFDEDRFHMALMKIRANLPEELKRASRVVKESEQMMSEARDSTEKMVTEARRNAQMDLQKARAEAEKLKQDTTARLEQERKEFEAFMETERRHLAEDVEQKKQETLDEAAAILNEARSQAALIISDSEIVRAAEAEANDIRLQAQRDAHELREGASQYAEDVLEHIYSVLGKAATEVERGQQTLREQR